MIEAGSLLTATGGLCELVGLGLVVKEIYEDREHARSLLSVRSKGAPRPPQYPGRFRAPPPSPYESMKSAAQLRSELSRDLGRVTAAVANALVDQRKAVDKQLIEAIRGLRDEIADANNMTRDHVRYVLVGSITKRAAGAVALGLGVVLEIAGALVSGL